MAERIRRIVLSLLSVFAFMVLLRGCGDPHNYSPEQAEQYLEERYGTDFTLYEAVIGTDTNSSTTAGTGTTYATLDPKHYCFHDADDIPCSFDMAAGYGCSSNKYYVNEDYQLQWLRHHPEIYSSLTDDGFVFAEDSYGLSRDITSYEEIEPVCREVFSVLRKDEALVPDSGSSKEWAVTAKHPLIRLGYDKDSSWTLFFRTKEKDSLTDEEVFTYRLQCLYAETHKKENIPDICDNTFIRLFRDGKALDVKMINKDMTYYTSDRISSGGRFRLETAEKVWEAAGLKVSKWHRNKLVVKNGSDTVEIIRRKKNNTIGNVEIEVLKNGKPYIPEGGKDEGVEAVKGEVSVYPVCTFTTSDYINLFGITFNYDFYEGTAEIR